MVILIKHFEHGVLVNEYFENNTQFKLYLESVHSAIQMEKSFTMFNGKDYLVNIPYDILKDCFILANTTLKIDGKEYLLEKSKMEKE